jgi:hypothetical protein
MKAKRHINEGGKKRNHGELDNKSLLCVEQ